MLDLTRQALLDVSAASGLVLHEGTLYVVADDQHVLARYGADGSPRGRTQLFPGDLPSDSAERKRRKPDLEALAALPDGRLLALGSGSTPARRRGAVLDRAGKHVVPVDLTELYVRLERDFPELNIEGAAVGGSSLWLAQRGNGPSGRHGLIELDLARVQAALARDARLGPDSLCGCVPVQLGSIDGVSLAITDLTPHPDGGLLFCAAAEASNSTYLDGECVGAVIGRLSLGGEVLSSEPTSTRHKLEGIAAAVRDATSLDIWLVADADDPAQPAPLLRATWPC